MAIEIVVTTDRFRSDPASRDFVDHVRSRQEDLELSDGVLYYDFPAYVDYEAEVNRPDILLFSPSHGFFAIRFVTDSMFRRSKEATSALDTSLNDFSSNLYARLLRSRELRTSRTKAVVDVFPIIFDASNDGIESDEDVESAIVHSFEEFDRLLTDSRREPLNEGAISEIRSVVEGAKALSRPQKRMIEDPKAQPLAVAMAKLEAEIANFDQKQRHIALIDVGGPARIRGLAGSGKTVILAMKVAHLHLNNPRATILITFLTKSLRATIKNLITKFYRHYSETDPDWKVIHIRHGWGGRSIPGVYSDACRRAGQSPLNLQEALRLTKRNDSAFAAICAALNETDLVRPYYDHVLIDEGQDFPPSFYQLCYRLAKGERDRKSIVWAYDELQDIMNVKIRQPEELFGIDADGQPRVLLDRSSANVPPGATNDAILSKCYRNQRDVLVTAHAMGFGVYGSIVQMLESEEHWQDVGYDVLSGPLVTGKKVEVIRPDRNSPVQIPPIDGTSLVDSYAASSVDDEASWVANEIRQ
jgi:superfamily I DNA and RNA helicase